MNDINLVIRSYDESIVTKLNDYLNESLELEKLNLDIVESTILQGLIEKEIIFNVLISGAVSISLNLISNIIWDFFKKNSNSIKDAKIIKMKNTNRKITIIKNKEMVIEENILEKELSDND